MATPITDMLSAYSAAKMNQYQLGEAATKARQMHEEEAVRSNLKKPWQNTPQLVAIHDQLLSWATDDKAKMMIESTFRPEYTGQQVGSVLQNLHDELQQYRQENAMTTVPTVDPATGQIINTDISKKDAAGKLNADYAIADYKAKREQEAQLNAPIVVADVGENGEVINKTLTAGNLAGQYTAKENLTGLQKKKEENTQITYPVLHEDGTVENKVILNKEKSAYDLKNQLVIGKIGDPVGEWEYPDALTGETKKTPAIRLSMYNKYVESLNQGAMIRRQTELEKAQLKNAGSGTPNFVVDTKNNVTTVPGMQPAIVGNNGTVTTPAVTPAVTPAATPGVNNAPATTPAAVRKPFDASAYNPPLFAKNSNAAAPAAPAAKVTDTGKPGGQVAKPADTTPVNKGYGVPTGKVAVLPGTQFSPEASRQEIDKATERSPYIPNIDPSFNGELSPELIANLMRKVKEIPAVVGDEKTKVVVPIWDKGATTGNSKETGGTSYVLLDIDDATNIANAKKLYLHQRQTSWVDKNGKVHYNKSLEQKNEEKIAQAAADERAWKLKIEALQQKYAMDRMAYELKNSKELAKFNKILADARPKEKELITDETISINHYDKYKGAYDKIDTIKNNTMAQMVLSYLNAYQQGVVPDALYNGLEKRLKPKYELNKANTYTGFDYNGNGRIEAGEFLNSQSWNVQDAEDRRKASESAIRALTNGIKFNGNIKSDKERILDAYKQLEKKGLIPKRTRFK